jgi:hypothetical protein
MVSLLVSSLSSLSLIFSSSLQMMKLSIGNQNGYFRITPIVFNTLESYHVHGFQGRCDINGTVLFNFFVEIYELSTGVPYSNSVSNGLTRAILVGDVNVTIIIAIMMNPATVKR